MEVEVEVEEHQAATELIAATQTYSASLSCEHFEIVEPV